MTSILLALVLTAQTPPATAPRPAADQRRELIERNRARRSARVAAGRARERAEASAAQRQQAEAEARYRAMLPFLLENQRQQLAAMDAAQRNAALDRMARAAQQQADAATLSAWWLWSRGR